MNMGDRWTVTDVRKAHERARRVLPQLGDLEHYGSHYEVHIDGMGTVYATGAQDAATMLHRMADAVVVAQHAAAVAVILSELEHGATWRTDANVLEASSDQDGERIGSLLGRIYHGSVVYRSGRIINPPYVARQRVLEVLEARSAVQS